MLPDTPLVENRLLEAMVLHTKQEVDYRLNNPTARRNDPHAHQLQLDHYRSVLEAYRKTKDLTPEERATRRYLRHAIRRNKLKNRSVVYQFAYRSVSFITASALGRRRNIVQHRKQIAKYEKGAAIERNIQIIGNQLREAGFNLVPDHKLQENLKHQLPRFDVRYYDPNHPKTDFVLHFKKLPGADAYFFAGFDAIARPTLRDVLRQNEQNPRTAFSMVEGPTFSASEAAHLTNGRPVYKELAGGNFWYRTTAEGPLPVHRVDFDLTTSVSQLPIKELKDAVPRESLLAALQSGAQREVTIQLAQGREEKVLLSLAGDLSGVQLHSKEGRYLDINDYTQRLAVAKVSHQQAQVRKLKPAQSHGRSRVAH